MQSFKNAVFSAPTSFLARASVRQAVRRACFAAASLGAGCGCSAARSRCLSARRLSGEKYRAENYGTGGKDGHGRPSKALGCAAADEASLTFAAILSGA